MNNEVIDGFANILIKTAMKTKFDDRVLQRLDSDNAASLNRRLDYMDEDADMHVNHASSAYAAAQRRSQLFEDSIVSNKDRAAIINRENRKIQAGKSLVLKGRLGGAALGGMASKGRLGGFLIGAILGGALSSAYGSHSEGSKIPNPYDKYEDKIEAVAQDEDFYNIAIARSRENQRRFVKKNKHLIQMRINASINNRLRDLEYERDAS